MMGEMCWCGGYEVVRNYYTVLSLCLIFVILFHQRTFHDYKETVYSPFEENRFSYYHSDRNISIKLLGT